MTAYWYRVLRMAQKQRRKTGRAANLVPAEPIGRALRVLWAPAIVVWMLHPVAASFWTAPPAFFRPLYALGPGRWAMLAVVFAGFLITRTCWRRMGANWRMGIDPGERNTLVFDGLFGYVRHPIYALSAFMMLATAIALPTPLMLIAAVIHVTLLLWESAREERHLLAVHGPAYQAYQRSVGRLAPRSWRRYVTPPP